MNDIDRFNYLGRYLTGQALATTSGLALNSENYKEALDVLIDRHGNPQVLVRAHKETLVEINKVFVLKPILCVTMLRIFGSEEKI